MLATIGEQRQLDAAVRGRRDFVPICLRLSHAAFDRVGIVDPVTMQGRRRMLAYMPVSQFETRPADGDAG